jgi:hypothetical protein
MNVTGVVLVLFALVVVAVIAYRAGYLRGQAELLHQGQPTEAEWNEWRMNSVLPRWRRVAGWAAYVFSGPSRIGMPRNLSGRDLARRVVLEAPPRGPRTAPVRRILNDRRHLRRHFHAPGGGRSWSEYLK